MESNYRGQSCDLDPIMLFWRIHRSIGSLGYRPFDNRCSKDTVSSSRISMTISIVWKLVYLIIFDRPFALPTQTMDQVKECRQGSCPDIPHYLYSSILENHTVLSGIAWDGANFLYLVGVGSEMFEYIIQELRRNTKFLISPSLVGKSAHRLGQCRVHGLGAVSGYVNGVLQESYLSVTICRLLIW